MKERIKKIRGEQRGDMISGQVGSLITAESLAFRRSALGGAFGVLSSPKALRDLSLYLMEHAGCRLLPSGIIQSLGDIRVAGRGGRLRKC